MNWLAVAGGAALGAWARWWLGVWLNTAHAALPFGTLAANLAGGFLSGLALAFFTAHPDLPATLRLFAVTGLLGALTTFSTFSAESFFLLQRGEVLWAFSHAALHLLGSLALCALGFWLYRSLS